MKKLILSIVFFIPSLLFLLTAYAQGAANLSGTWSRDGNSYTGQSTDNSISIIGKNGAGFEGKITGNIAQGKEHLVSEKCPNLSHDSPATATISADGSSITVTFTNNTYDLEKCTDDPNTDFKDTHTYTKTSAQNSPTVTMLPSPSPTETPLNLNGTWVATNSFGISYTFSGQHVGNSVTLQITDASDGENIGKISLEGTLTGHTFIGKQILIAYKCPGVVFYVDATGTVDNSSITVSFTNFRYNVNTCAKVPGSESENSFTYSRVITGQNPTRGEDVKQISPSPEISKTVEKPSVGVSSKDFRALARANAEFQKAQADLEKIKAEKDPRWEAKKDFAQSFQDRLQTYPEEQKDTIQIMRDDLEEVKSDAELYQKVKDFADWFKGTDLDNDSGGMSAATAVGNGLIDFIDLMSDGVSADDAAAKVLIDSTAVDLNPFVKTADMVATLPDEIMAALGISPDHWSRKPTTYLYENSPSAFVELTTDSMIKTHNFTNVGGAIQVALDDLKKAEGFGDKVQATVDLAGTVVGAIPVAIAMQARDTISTMFDVVKAGGVTNFLTNRLLSWD